MSASPRLLFAFALLVVGASARAEGEPPARTTTDLSRGLRFEPRLTAIAQAPSDPNVIYVGSEYGRVHVSRDGGRTWIESTAQTKRGRFYGSLRAQGEMSRITSGWSQPSGSSYGAIAGFILPSKLSDPFDQSPGGGLEGTRATGQDLSPGDPLVGALTGLESTKRSSSSSEARRLYDDSLIGDDEDFGGGGDGGGSDLGVGIRARAPRLAVQVRRIRGWNIGINLQQTLALRAAAATAVWFFDVNPADPDDVLAATADGLLRSRDGGGTWPLVLTGPTPPERIINQIARDPTNPKRLFVGTGRGMHVSMDGGETFDRIEHPFIVSSDVRWIDIDPTRPQTLYVGATWGLLRSTDGGVNFSIAFLNPWPPLNLVRQVMVDPHRPERIWLATADGLMVRDGEKAEFDRAGGLLFVGTNVRCLSTDGTPGHLIAVTDTDVWETRDAGV
ncbi:MAG: hypothetical protein KC620_12785, partial [Myxococcales bacterium]|nr:hypothetical protein [Myxococcales bacterium]